MTERDHAGFVVLPAVVSAPEATALLAALAESRVHRTRAGARHTLSDPAVSAVAQDQRLIGIASDALGGSAFPFRATLFDKSPRANWLVVWHQDTTLPLTARRDVGGWGPWSVKAGVLYAHAPAEALAGVVALRLHLDDSSSENGPLKVLPGTHRLGVLTGAQIRDLSRAIHSVECTVAKGGLVAMRPLLIHSSSKASGSTPRRVLHIEYATSRKLEHLLELDVADQGVAADEAPEDVCRTRVLHGAALRS